MAQELQTFPLWEFKEACGALGWLVTVAPEIWTPPSPITLPKDKSIQKHT